jgi:5-formyltetrahydrofolate cyclo-ligase
MPSITQTKAELRKVLRQKRDAEAAGLPDAVRALVFNRPPAPMLELIAPDETIGFYHAYGSEAPTASYARFFHERGHTLALPRFSDKNAAMEFARYSDPFGDSDCETGPFGMLQPRADAPIVSLNTVFVPLIGCTATGQRLGQGGGHYDRWLAQNPEATAIALAWDGQVIDTIPTEAHDVSVKAIITPTCMFGPF